MGGCEGDVGRMGVSCCICAFEDSIVYFACHEVQDLRNPFHTALILHDNRLLLLKLTHTWLPNAQLIFLSARETAQGANDHPDEAVHLAAGMLATGFCGAIGTM